MIQQCEGRINFINDNGDDEDDERKKKNKFNVDAYVVSL